jgi:hypothetical protein
MRKRILDPSRSVRASAEFDGGWLDLRDIATVEVTSEDDRFPIESVFDEPASLRRIRLRFVEDESERTQEFSLRWCPAAGGSTEIFRQQWNFSPAGSRTELEEYAVSLEGVSALELAIQPDLNRNDSIATLAEWRVGGHR